MLVLANGCFTLVHYGHLLHLTEARAMGDSLTVALTSDETARREKPGRIAFDETQRAASLRALRCVDDVIVVDNVIEALERVRPDVFVKGPDYVGKIEPAHEQYCHDHGIEIRFTSAPKWSTTALLREAA
jgi:cytidyltransferase-like protein